MSRFRKYGSQIRAPRPLIGARRSPDSAQANHRRIQSWCYANSANYYNESSDGPVLEFVALCNVEVQNVFVGIQRGFTGTPVACALAGIEIAEKAHRAGGQLGTAPTGNGTNILDPTATAIVSGDVATGDVATWDFLAPLAVLVADEDTDALFPAGAAGTAPIPNCRNGLTQVWTLNNNTSVGAPTNPPQTGQTLTLVFVQDATGGRTIAWNAAYRNAPTWAAGLAGQRALAEFKYTGSSWQFVGGSTAFG